MEEEKALLAETIHKASAADAKWMKRHGKGVGVWLTRLPSRLEETHLTRDELHNNLVLLMGGRPRGLLQQCDGRGANFTVQHGLSFKKGGLMT